MKKFIFAFVYVFVLVVLIFSNFTSFAMRSLIERKVYECKQDRELEKIFRDLSGKNKFKKFFGDTCNDFDACNFDSHNFDLHNFDEHDILLPFDSFQDLDFAKQDDLREDSEIEFSRSSSLDNISDDVLWHVLFQLFTKDILENIILVDKNMKEIVDKLTIEQDFSVFEKGAIEKFFSLDNLDYKKIAKFIEVIKSRLKNDNLIVLLTFENNFYKNFNKNNENWSEKSNEKSCEKIRIFLDKNNFKDRLLSLFLLRVKTNAESLRLARFMREVDAFISSKKTLADIFSLV